MRPANRLRASLFLWLVLSLAFVPSITPGTTSAEDTTVFPYMRPDDQTFHEWVRAYDRAPRTTAAPALSRAASGAPGGSVSLLEDIDYVPSDRSQGACGNCWAWAGTGCMEIALDRQEGIRERLSVQFVNSCQYAVIGKECCRGGWLSDFTLFYQETGFCVPWSNGGAGWQDSDYSCDTACGSISTEPRYDIESISALTVPTHQYEGVGSDNEARENIKDVLESGRGVWFAFFVPTSTAWYQFTNFWLYQDEDVICDLDSICSGTSRYSGHAVLCVGYEEDEGEDYWVMLNSWGTAGGNRPNGTFRVEMDMDYDTTCGGTAFFWQTLEVDFGLPEPPVVSTDSASDIEETSARLHGTLVDDSGWDAECRFAYGVEGTGEPLTTEWQTGLTNGTPYYADIASLSAGTRYSFRAQGANFGGLSSGETVAFVTKPLPPADFYATADGESAADITWTKATGADRTVIRGKKGTVPTGPGDGHAVYDGTGTSCTDEGLDPGSTYWYAAWSVIDDAQQGEVWSDESTSDDTATIGNGYWMEGDVNLDARCDIVDAMLIAQYTVGLHELDDTQMLCADTTDDGKVNIVDAMHIAQFTVDPDMSADVLFKLVWESPADDGLLDPLDA